jgi:deoxyadenosine/deoxycytidine kinase
LFEKDKVYAYQTLTDDELIVYERIYSLLRERVGKPDLVIYLQISLETLLKSIAKEGSALEKNISEKYLEDVIAKEGSALEKNISEKYLEDVIEAFDYFFFNYQAAPLLVVKTDGLDFDREADIIDLLDKIKKMKKKSMYYVPLGKENKHLKKLK